MQAESWHRGMPWEGGGAGRADCRDTVAGSRWWGGRVMRREWRESWAFAWINGRWWDYKRSSGWKIVVYILDMLFEEILEKLRRGSLCICNGSWRKDVLINRSLYTNSVVFIDFWWYFRVCKDQKCLNSMAENSIFGVPWIMRIVFIKDLYSCVCWHLESRDRYFPWVWVPKPWALLSLLINPL